MNNAIDLWMCGKDFIEFCLVGDVDLVEGWPFPTEQLDAIEGYDRGIVQAVDNYHVVIIFEKGEGCEGSDVSRTTVCRVWSAIGRGGCWLRCFFLFVC